MTQLQSFSHLHKICQSAVKKIHYPSVIEELHKNLDKEYWGLAEATIIYFLPRAILDLPTKLERQEALASIPGQTNPTNLKQFVEEGILHLWEIDKENELQRRSKSR
jgi:hypothetical protein